jgi:hypothetical protein
MSRQPHNETQRETELTEQQLETVTGGDKSKTTSTTQTKQTYYKITMTNVLISSY